MFDFYTTGAESTHNHIHVNGWVGEIELNRIYIYIGITYQKPSDVFMSEERSHLHMSVSSKTNK